MSLRLYLAALADCTAVRTCWCLCKNGRRKDGRVAVGRARESAAADMLEKHDGQERDAMMG